MEFQTYQDAANLYRWRLVADNGEPIADCGQGYKRKEDRDHGIELLKKFCAEACIIESEDWDG